MANDDSVATSMDAPQIHFIRKSVKKDTKVVTDDPLIFEA